MTYALAWYASVVLAACPNGPHEPPVRPQVGEFAVEAADRQLADAARRNRSLSDVLMTPSREWVAFVVGSYWPDYDAASAMAVGAYHVPSGRKRQLSFSPLPQPPESRVAMELVRWGDDSCGVVVGLSSPLSEQARSESDDAERSQPLIGRDPPRLQWKRFLWTWNLSTDEVQFVGPWNSAKSMVAEVVQPGRCGLCGTTFVSQGTSRLMVRDKASGRTATVSLRLSRGIHDTDGTTMIATTDPCAFAVCDAHDAHDAEKADLRVYCVDPNAPGGIRWKLAHGDIEAAIGPGIRGAAFLQQRGRTFRSLPLFVHRPVDADVSRTHLLLLRQKDGTIERQYSLPFDAPWPKPPILSPDYKRLVFLHQDILFMGRPPATAEEIGTADFILQFRVVDLESGTFRDTENHYGRLPLCWLQGFLDGERVLLSDDRALWTLDTGNLRLRELFRIAE
ncbi:MAG: hypothetical protein RBS80_00945 [Thermoguttaceae bacterium]|jgi:hypothetical protein|nr:hypothetical protein [Thermoguttaceae bacterium]